MKDFNHEQFREQGANQVLERRLLVGIDAPLTPITRYALHTAGEFFAPYAEHVHFLLLHVIPAPVLVSRYAPPRPLAPTIEQRMLAEETLHAACAILQQHRIVRSHLVTIIRVGTPVDHIVQMANHASVNCLILGSHTSTPGQWLRRFCMGSTSHAAFHRASCPVMLITPPRSRPSVDLVRWYEEALQRMLREQTSSLVNITARQAADQFVPPQVQVVGVQENTAASQALEHLAQAKRLYRQEVNGEMHYIND